MWATGATPRRVTAFYIFAPTTQDVPIANHNGDKAAIITTQNDDGSVFRITGCAAFGAHHNAYRICGTNGQIENLRGMKEQVMLRYNEWQVPEGMEKTNLYLPEWNDPDEKLIESSGHGGADYLTARTFLECIRQNKQPEHPFDIYSAVTMSSVAILAHRSALEGGKPYDVPDLTTPAGQAAYAEDHLTPFPGEDGSAPSLPCCSHPDYAPTEAQLALFKKALE